MKNDKYKIVLKADKEQRIAFAQGEKGEILYVSLFPGTTQTDPRTYLPLRDRIIDHDHHLKHPDEYVTIKEVDQSEATMLFGLPEITPFTAAQNDLRQGIKVVSEQALREIKG